MHLQICIHTYAPVSTHLLHTKQTHNILMPSESENDLGKQNKCVGCYAQHVYGVEVCLDVRICIKSSWCPLNLEMKLFWKVSRCLNLSGCCQMHFFDQECKIPKILIRCKSFCKHLIIILVALRRVKRSVPREDRKVQTHKKMTIEGGRGSFPKKNVWRTEMDRLSSGWLCCLDIVERREWVRRHLC